MWSMPGYAVDTVLIPTSLNSGSEWPPRQITSLFDIAKTRTETESTCQNSLILRCVEAIDWPGVSENVTLGPGPFMVSLLASHVYTDGSFGGIEVVDYKFRFSQILRRAVGDHAISELSRRTGLSRQQLHRYFSGEAIPRADAFLSLCAHIGLDPWEFMSGDARGLNDLRTMERIPSEEEMPAGIYKVYTNSMRQPGKVAIHFKIVSADPVTSRLQVWYRYPRWVYQFPNADKRYRIGRGEARMIGKSLQILTTMGPRDEFGEKRNAFANFARKVTSYDIWFGVRVILSENDAPLVTLRTALHHIEETDYRKCFRQSRIVELADCPALIRSYLEKGASKEQQVMVPLMVG